MLPSIIRSISFFFLFFVNNISCVLSSRNILNLPSPFSHSLKIVKITLCEFTLILYPIHFMPSPQVHFPHAHLLVTLTSPSTSSLGSRLYFSPEKYRFEYPFYSTTFLPASVNQHTNRGHICIIFFFCKVQTLSVYLALHIQTNLQMLDL